MMKMNRKVLALLVSAMLAASAAGCGNPAEDSGPAQEAMASLTGAGGEPAATAGPTAEPATEPTAEPTAESTATPTAEPTAEPTVAPTAAPTEEPTAEPTAAPTTAPTVEPTTEPTTAPAQEPEPTAPPEEQPADTAPLVLVPNAPATSGVVESTETVTTQVAHQRPEGMPEVCYSADEATMAMLFYGQPGDGYVDNGDGTWTYCWCGPDGSTTDTVTTTVTTTNWFSGTEADVLARLGEIRAMYPEGSYWGADSVYDNPGSTLDAYISNDNACAGFVKLVSDYLFGHDAPCAERWVSADQVRPGDIGYNADHAWVYTGEYWVDEFGQHCLGDISGNVAGTVSSSYSIGGQECRVITRWPE